MGRILKWVAYSTLVALLAACGGGGGSAGTCELCGGDGTTGKASALRVTLSASSISTQAPAAVTVTVTAVDSANVVVADVPVTVTASSGDITVTDTVTSSSGVLTATLEMGSDTTPRTITITASSGSITGTATVAVVNSATAGAASLSVSLSSDSITSTSPATVTAVLLDATGNPVPSSVIKFSSDGSLGTFSATSALTNSAGQAQVILYPASNTTTGADYVTAATTLAGSDLTASAGFKVSPTNVTIASVNTGLGSAALAAYGQTAIDVTLAGTTSGSPVTLSIASVCANKSKATLTPTSVTTNTGTASFTYRDVQCGSTDSSDVVTIAITGTTTSSTVSIPLTAPAAGSMGFVSASPSTIYLRGSGYTETSVVTFVVNDQSGNPLPGKSVRLTPTTMVGGITIDTLGINSDGSFPVITKVSDSNGQVSVRIASGTVPTPMRVKATLVETGASTVSSNLSIAVGLPSQMNFSLSQGTINIEGGNVDGTQNTYTLIASDRMANPVPAGTTINFVAEGGQIQSQGFTTTSSGLASTTVNFQSSEPRPTDGRITIVAYALGEESFLDANGDNVYNATESFQDLGAVFLSRKFSKDFNASQSDQFIRGSDSASCTAPGNALLALNASIPSKSASCDGVWSSSGYVRRAAETVLSYSSSRLLWYRSGAGVIAGASGGTLDSSCSVQSIVTADDGFTQSSTSYFRMGSGGIWNLPSQGVLSFVVADANDNRLNPMPAGTTLEVTASTGLTVAVLGGSPVPNTSEATGGAVSYAFATGVTSGAVYISTTSPGGVKTSWGTSISTQAVPAACTQ